MFPTREVVLVGLVLFTVALAGCATEEPQPGEESNRSFEVPDVQLTPALEGLDSPTFLTAPDDGTGRLFVLEQEGRVLVLDDEGAPETYLDISDRVQAGGERGLLGLAFDPGFEANGRLIASYTDTNGDSVLERFTVTDPETGQPSPDEGRVLLTQEQPYGNHNGGHIAFGPDGYLYYGLGDGGSAGDPQGNAQDTSTWLGSILRLDVSGEEARAPSGNPFVDEEGAEEIWAYGLRNPWRFSFDPVTGDLFIGDVGQNAWEEVNRQPADSGGGENYGWDRWEGNHVFEGDGSREGFTFPILEYPREGGHCSVTGGYVYRGEAIPELEGAYVFGDYCSGVVWMAFEEEGEWSSEVLLETDLRISSFGVDDEGELFVVDHGGSVQRVAAR